MYPDAARTHTTFAQLAAEGADVSRIMDMAISRWCEVAAALSPIIGQPGVSALFKRSIYLTCVDYPSLAVLRDDAFLPGEFAALRDALAQETSANLAAANDALLRTFLDLLANLIGAPLAERLLGSVGNHPSSGEAVQDTVP
jgi:hypothetical protein